MRNREGIDSSEKQPQSKDNTFDKRHASFKLGNDTGNQGDGRENCDKVLPDPPEGREYLKVEIVGKRGEPLGEIDRLRDNVIIEDKNAKGIDTPRPITGVPVQTAEQWAERHIYEKTETRIENLQLAVSTRPTKDGSQEAPSLDKVKSIREIQFHIETRNPEIEKATERQLDNLRSRFPEWRFAAFYGK